MSSEYINCVRCLKIPTKPLTMECQHAICQKCLPQTQELHYNCPSCSQRISLKKVTRNMLFEQALKELQYLQLPIQKIDEMCFDHLQDIILFCIDCSLPICLACANYGAHVKHNIKDLKYANIYLRHNLQDQIEEKIKIKSFVDQTIQTNHVQKFQEQFNFYLEKLKNQTDEISNCIIENVQLKQKAAQQRYNKIKFQIFKLQSNLKLILKYLLDSKKIQELNMDERNKFIQFLSQNSDSSAPNWVFQSQQSEKLQHAIESFGQIFAQNKFPFDFI